MRRMLDLVSMAKKSHPKDSFFTNYDETIRASRQARAQFMAYDRALSYLDDKSWDVLSRKTITHFKDHRKGQRKQGFFFQLNEVFAYQFLVKRGYKNVAVLEEDGTTKPDIVYMDGAERRYCEVKSLGLSDDELAKRAGGIAYDINIYDELSEGFLNKLLCALSQASMQISSQRGGDGGLIFVVAQFDDFTAERYSTYRKQILQAVNSHEAPEVFVKFGLVGGRRIHKRFDSMGG